MATLKRRAELLGLFLPCLLGLAGIRATVSRASSELGLPLAGGAVRSREWTIHRHPPEEEFTGEVSYQGDGISWRSDWALWNRKTRLWRARGKVTARRRGPSGAELELEGDQARYDMRAEEGDMTARDKIRAAWKTRVSAPGGEWTGLATAQEARWSGKEPRLVFKRAVRLSGRRQGENLRARSEFALYTPSSGELRLKEGPPILEAELPDWSGALRAERILAEPDGSLRAHEGVTGWIIFHAPRPR